MEPNRERLYFLFVGYGRDWRPQRGRPAPAGKVCVLRSMPGGIVAGGRTFDEAKKELQSALERAFERAGGAREWYEAALSLMTPEELGEFDRYWTTVRDRGLPLEAEGTVSRALVVNENGLELAGAC